MSRPFAMPDLGEGLTEAEIIKVLVREGDVISEDSPLLEVETDKATVEIPSPFSGRVAGIHVQPGQTVKVGHVLVTFDDAAVVTAGSPLRLPAPPGTRGGCRREPVLSGCDHAGARDGVGNGDGFERREQPSGGGFGGRERRSGWGRAGGAGAGDA